MIDKVIILGIRRAGELIPDFDIAQMVGRCGRSYVESGEATLIVPSCDEHDAERYLFSKPKPIRSSFDRLDDVSFHFLPELPSDQAIGEDLFCSWFSRSLASMQGINIDWKDLIDYLEENECIVKMKDQKILLSDLGKIVCSHYIRPNHVFRMKSRLETICSPGQLDPTSVGWILSFEKIYKNLTDDFSFQEFISNTEGRRMYFEDQEEIDAYSWFCLFSGKSPKTIRNEIVNRRKDISRMISCLQEISLVLGLDIHGRLKELEACGSRGIPFEFSKIAAAFPDAGRKIILELDSLSIHSLEDMIENSCEINRYGSDSLKQYARSKSISLE